MTRFTSPIAEIAVSQDGWLTIPGGRMRCALGRSGLTGEKREGDGATPIGVFPLRELLYRPDRLSPPETGLPIRPIAPADGWCDDPADPAYNRPVALPYGGRHEELWRADGLYDLVVPLGYNDDPVRPGLGSAIFVHVAHADYAPTEGCIALALADLTALLPLCGPENLIRVNPD